MGCHYIGLHAAQDSPVLGSKTATLRVGNTLVLKTCPPPTYLVQADMKLRPCQHPKIWTEDYSLEPTVAPQPFWRAKGLELALIHVSVLTVYLSLMSTGF